MNFPGSDPASDDALDHLYRCNLPNDQQFMDLVEICTAKNPISDYKMALSGMEEPSANFTSASKTTTETTF